MVEKLQETLKASRFSLTKSRRLVFQKLHDLGPLSVADLSDACQPQVDRATVYRSVDLFERLGVVNRIWHGFKNHVELSEIFTPHHHHAVCQNCGRTIDITSQALESLVANIAKEHAFITVNHSVELSGYCKNCQ